MIKRSLIALAAVSTLLAGGAAVLPAQAATAAKAETRVTGFNAGPEPVASGDDLTVVGHLDRKSATTWVPLTNAPVSIQRKVTGGKYVGYRTSVTNGVGDVRVTFPVTVQASYRLVYAGTSTTAAVTGAGDNVAVAATSVTVTTAVTGWPDTDTAGGIWARDHFSREVTVTRGAKVEGGYRYSFTVTDHGGFVSGKNVPSPNDPTVNLHGVVRGSFDGGISSTFTANSRYLVAANVPATEDGSDGKVAGSGQWGKLALPAGVEASDFGAAPYSWTYEAPGTCETLTQSDDGLTGNIRGINACE